MSALSCLVVIAAVGKVCVHLRSLTLFDFLSFILSLHCQCLSAHNEQHWPTSLRDWCSRCLRLKLRSGYGVVLVVLPQSFLIWRRSNCGRMPLLALLGLGFKPGTPCMRDHIADPPPPSPSLTATQRQESLLRVI